MLFLLKVVSKLASFMFVALIKFYKLFISQWLSVGCLGLQCRCRFQPTCSEYALQSLQKYAFIKACWLIGRRLLRCHPFSSHGGFDPVP